MNNACQAVQLSPLPQHKEPLHPTKQHLLHPLKDGESPLYRIRPRLGHRHTAVLLSHTHIEGVSLPPLLFPPGTNGSWELHDLTLKKHSLTLALRNGILILKSFPEIATQKCQEYMLSKPSTIGDWPNIRNALQAKKDIFRQASLAMLPSFFTFLVGLY